MQPITVKKRSWHYWLATELASWKPFREIEVREWNEERQYQEYKGSKQVPNDFCSYVRSVIFGTLVATFFASILLVVLLANIAGIFYLVEALVFHVNYIGLKEFAVAPVITVTIGVAIAVVALFKKWVYSRPYVNKYEKPPKPETFTKAAYRSFKDKVCFTINVED